MVDIEKMFPSALKTLLASDAECHALFHWLAAGRATVDLGELRETLKALIKDLREDENRGRADQRATKGALRIARRLLAAVKAEIPVIRDRRVYEHSLHVLGTLNAKRSVSEDSR